MQVCNFGGSESRPIKLPHDVPLSGGDNAGTILEGSTPSKFERAINV